MPELCHLANRTWLNPTLPRTGGSESRSSKRATRDHNFGELLCHAATGDRYRNIQDTGLRISALAIEALSLIELKKMQKAVTKATST